jgi:hypothetical protein
MVARVLDRWGVWFAAAVAFCLALPGLAFPFLSDDWIQIESVESGVPLRTPFEDFRPIYMMSLWLDRALWGLSPAGFHLTNALLIAVCAALVVQVCRRYTGERALAGAAGLLFALHPYHVENAAWIGARGDPLVAVPFLAALLAYDRWRSRRTGIPWLAIGLFVIALLAKETAVSLAPCLMAIGWIDRSRRPDSREWGRGYAPLLGVALLHFAIVRPYFLGGAGRTLAEGFGLGWVKNALGLGVAGFLPLDVSILAFRPWTWGSVALVLGLAVLIAAWRGSGVGRIAFGATLVFILLLAPYVVGFQERYLFLPAAASALVLASLIRSARRYAATAISVFLAVAWLACGAVQWLDWREAARASERLVEQLSLASRDPAVEEIVVANMPLRVRGGSVGGDFRAALALSGEREVSVLAATWVSYPSSSAEALAEDESALERGQESVYVRLQVSRSPFSRYIGPEPGTAGGGRATGTGAVARLPDGTLRVRVDLAPGRGRAVYAWSGGELIPLATPGPEPEEPV